MQESLVKLGFAITENIRGLPFVFRFPITVIWFYVYVILNLCVCVRIQDAPWEPRRRTGNSISHKVLIRPDSICLGAKVRAARQRLLGT
jgi:hypothetical protein